MSRKFWENQNIAKLLLIIAFAYIVIAGLILINSYQGDPSIYFIYAKNIAHFDFFSYNPGEFSSGATSPLWALILAPPFLFSNATLLVKIYCLLLTLLSFYIAYKSFLYASNSKLGSAFGLAFLLYYALLPSLMCYETPLTIILISWLLIVNKKIILGNKKPGVLILLCILWALIPLARPDAIAIIIIDAFMLTWFNWKNKKHRLLIPILFFSSLIPLAAYFAFSNAKTGMVSNSSYCRAFALQETAKHFMGLSISVESIFTLISYPMLLFAIMIILQINNNYKFLRENLSKKNNLNSISQNNFFAILAFLIAGAYFVSITFISPVSDSVERYIIPIIPFIIIAIAKQIEELFATAKVNNWIMLTLFLILTFFAPYIKVSAYVAQQWSNHFDFDTIAEKNLIAYVNQIAEPNSTLLSYEVQDRYYLRDDIDLLSLDGITDGKVAPYLSTSKMDEFLKKYRPNYWLANDAVHYRPYLQKSILKNVLDSLEYFNKDTIQISDVTFIRIYTNPAPKRNSFAHSNYLFKIRYEK
ncbi:MAG TPA: hypothetical protein PLC04_05715 [Candidatus Kapabacteria bacterium]|nr:hypothetical protein [Candidatus Kapabacteria bacterium]